MTHHEQDDLSDLPDVPDLDRAIQAMNAQTLPDGPPESLVTSTVEALRAHEMSDAAEMRRTTNRREIMFRFAKYGTLGTAASIAIVLGLSAVMSGLSSQTAFAQAIQNVRDAAGAKYKLTQKLGSQPPMTSESAFFGGIIRTEVAGQFVFLANTQTRETLHLIPSQKIALRGKAGGAAMDQPFSISDIMKEMTEEHGELVQTIIDQDGTKTEIYRVTEFPDFMGKGKMTGEDEIKVWVDSATKLPTRIEVHGKMGPKGSLVNLEFTDFEWNPIFPAGHFDMTIPDGYLVQ